MQQHGRKHGGQSIHRLTVRFSLICLLVALAVSLPAYTTVKKERFKANEHIVMVNGDGELIDPRANFQDPDLGYHVSQ